MSQFMYVIGEPGSGKSTLVEHLTRGLQSRELPAPFAVREYDCGVTELGVRGHGHFPGTDGLSMSVQPKVVSWLRTYAPPLVLAEGDRLGNATFFDELVAMGYTLRLYAFHGPEMAALQRKIRGWGIGKQQDEKWIAGRRTKVQHLIDSWWPKIMPVGAPLAELEKAIGAHEENLVAQRLADARESAASSAMIAEALRR